MENWQILVKEKEFNDCLMEWNKKVNLVSRRKKDVFGLIEDSRLFFGSFGSNKPVKVLDLGTGGGFPGIVIAINYPEYEIVLVDSVQKKVNAVCDIIARLGIFNVSAVCSRAEDLAKLPGHKNKYDFVVARSVAVLQDLCRWSKDLVKPGGKLVTVKGGNIKGEINAASKLKYVKNVSVKESAGKLIAEVSF
jgi:16S rRNA (guanine527-N7)-methyltransferase